MKNLPEKKSIVIVQPILAHYRDSLFARLVACPEFDIHVLAGKQIDNVKEIDEPSPKIEANLINKKIKADSHSLIWQAGVFKYVMKQRPNIIVLTGVDPHLLSNLLLAIFNKIFLHAKIIWWGHATVNSKGKTGKYFRRFFFNLGHGVFTYSNAARQNVQSLISSKIPVVAIKNCINNEEYGFNYHFDNVIERKELTILFSGRITGKKRLDILIDAMALLQNKNFEFRCLIIGEGPQKAAAEKQVLDCQLSDSVNFLGERYGKESRCYFEQADLFVLPGKVGLSIIHGLSFGLPVLTSDRLEIHSPEFEIIQPGYNGDFFSGFDPQSLSEKIIEWSKKISNNKQQIAARCISSVKEEGYTPEIMSEKMIDFFRNVSNA